MVAMVVVVVAVAEVAPVALVALVAEIAGVAVLRTAAGTGMHLGTCPVMGRRRNHMVIDARLVRMA
jgi:hypothetical protein